MPIMMISLDKAFAARELFVGGGEIFLSPLGPGEQMEVCADIHTGAFNARIQAGCGGIAKKLAKKRMRTSSESISHYFTDGCGDRFTEESDRLLKVDRRSAPCRLGTMPWRLNQLK
jgi:hypothetical protein